MSFQQCRFNFGAEPFKYPPKRSYQNFNNNATLAPQDKVSFFFRFCLFFCYTFMLTDLMILIGFLYEWFSKLFVVFVLLVQGDGNVLFSVSVDDFGQSGADM